MSATCLVCGTVAFEVGRLYAEASVKEFNEWFVRQTAETKDNYGNRIAQIEEYEKCWCGNSYRNFRPSRPGDCPDGCTLSPIIKRDE